VKSSSGLLTVISTASAMLLAALKLKSPSAWLSMCTEPFKFSGESSVRDIFRYNWGKPTGSRVSFFIR
jgi:hypothetical protein